MADESPQNDKPVPRSEERFDLAPRDGLGWGGASPAGAPYDDEGPDLGRLLYVLWQRKWWIMLATAAGVAAGVFLYQRAEPVYETHASIWIESGEDQETGPVQAQEIFQGRGWSDLFTSLSVLRPVASDFDLHLSNSLRGTPLARNFGVTDSVRSGRYRLAVDSGGSYELLRLQGEGSVVDRGAVGDSVGRDLGFRWAPTESDLDPGTSVEFRVVSPTQAAIQLRQSLNVAYNPRSGNIINSHLRWSDGEEAARIHNRVVNTFIDVASRLKSQKLKEVVSILERQTEYAEERLAKAELSLKQARIENITLPSPTRGSESGGEEMTRGPVFESYFEDKIQSEQLQADIEKLRSILQTQQDNGELNVVRLRTVNSLTRAPELQASIDSLTEKQARRRSLLTTYTEGHPDVQTLTTELRSLTDQVIPGQIRNLLRQLENERAGIQQALASREGELRDIPPRIIEEERLRREMEQAEELHSGLLSRLNNAQLAASTSMPNLQVVDRAYPPSAPVSNQGPRYFMLASLAGLGLGIGGTLVFDQFDDRIREPEDIESGLGLPVLGIIPRINSGSTSAAETQGVLESFRSVRAQLTRLGGAGSTSVMVTSAEPEDGKSLVAANLAISFANGGRRTVLVDADVRRGDVHRLLGIDGRPGLTDVLSGGADLGEVLQTTDVEGLAAIPSGRLHGFNPDHLDGEAFDALMDRLRSSFDAVVIDSAPLAAGADAPIVAEHCDQTLMVIRAGRTDQELVRTRMEASSVFDISRLSVVLNDVPDSAPYYRYYSPSDYYYLEGAADEREEVAS